MMELRWIICLHSLEGADVGRVRANERITVEVCSPVWYSYIPW